MVHILHATAESFPIFTTGDIFIKTELVTPPRQWQLHSSILTRFSSWFSRSLSSIMMPTIGPAWASYTIEEIDGKVVLVQQQTTEEKPVISNTGSHHDADVAIKTEHEDSDSSSPFSITPDHTAIIGIYNDLFSAFYNVSINIPTTNIAASLTHSEQLTKLAGDLGCLDNLPNLRSQINATLLQHRHALLRAIKNDPARWLILSLSLHNESIYTEALIHMSGAHPSWPWPTPCSSLPEEIVRLITAKSLEQNKRCTEIERDLLLLTIHVGRGASSHPVSLLVNSEFDTWFIVSTFRSIIAQEFTNLHDDPKGSLRRATIYRKIWKGEGYMPYEDMRRMLEQVMPSAVASLSEDLAILKREASAYVEDLAKNESLLDVERQKVGWLTCVKVGKGDIPWRAGEQKN
ncbi:uncharacterized protein J4E84_003523 [Alternaria hordeiaustralica]|uniref:uncharacterized protein n=1 Tax=Alternaria hordeiaustralica TaxID=1187925 RepID=UPI0020C3DCF2|nr:uncharacterized protein J4E84_003523 [Alternaria hordeiaustralica]KAI4691232.1 hypothetical protein J4E84_003523 [Alternaria hordeiaustralica]